MREIREFSPFVIKATEECQGETLRNFFVETFKDTKYWDEAMKLCVYDYTYDYYYGFNPEKQFIAVKKILKFGDIQVITLEQAKALFREFPRLVLIKSGSGSWIKRVLKDINSKQIGFPYECYLEIESLEDIRPGMGTRFCAEVREISPNNQEVVIKKIRKAPIGLKPLYILQEERLQEIQGAIRRYLDGNEQIPIEWINEHNELLEIIVKRLGWNNTLTNK